MKSLTFSASLSGVVDVQEGGGVAEVQVGLLVLLLGGFPGCAGRRESRSVTASVKR
jgi:hypothetical protein